MTHSVTVFSLVVLTAAVASGQEREPWYGRARDYLSKVSPVPDDPAELAKNVAEWEAIRSGKNTRTYKDFGVVISMTEEQLRAVVPRQTAAYKPGCVNCKDRGLGRGEITKAGRWFWPYRFDPLKPEEAVCSKCGLKFPNTRYPTNRRQTFYSPAGVKTELEYWEDPRTKTRYFINVEIEGLGWQWMEKNALTPLIEAYHDTGDEEYAYRGSILMDEVANKFPAYVLGTNTNKQLKSAFAVKADGSMGGRVHGESTDTRIGYRAPSEKMGGGVLQRAYDAFVGTEGMQRLSRELGRDVRQHYTENLLYLTDRGLIDSDPSKHSGDWKQGLPGEPAVRLGLMLGRPDYLRWYIKCQEMSGFREFYADGGYPEGPGYCCLALNPRSNMRMLNGYTDPADFDVPPGETQYDNWEYPWGRYYPDGELEDFWRRAYTIWEDIALPDGSPPTFNDANHDSRGPSAVYQDRYTPLKESRCVLKPNLKHVILGDGSGNEQFQIHMGFGRAGAHAHHDTLGIQLYGMGHYLLDDIPYPKHIMRGLYSENWAHNTVTIDRKSQSGSHGGDVIFYAPSFEGLSAVRVNATDAYPGIAEVYSRTLVAVTTDSQHPYVLDVFRIKGGKVHDYMLYSSSYLMPTEAVISLTEMKTLPGERPLLPEGMVYKRPKDYAAARQSSGMPDPYGIFMDVSVGDATDGFTLDYRPKRIWEPQEEPSEKNGYDPRKGSLYVHPDKPQVGTLHHVAGQAKMQAMMAKICRSPKLDNLAGDLPVLILRSEPDDETLFVVVHEPYLVKGHITSVKRLPSRSGELVVDVSMPNRSDRIIMSTNEQPLRYSSGGVRTDAILAVVSAVRGKFPSAWMVGGTSFEFPALNIKLERESARFSGTITNSFRRMDGDSFYGFELTGENLPPEGDALRGDSIIVQNRHPGDWGEFKSENDKRIHYDSTVAGLSLNLYPDGTLKLLAAGNDRAPMENSETLHTDETLNAAELKDGVTIELTANENGWSLNAIGAESIEPAQGKWGRLSYTDLFSDKADIRVQTSDTRERRARCFLDEIVVEGQGGNNKSVLFRDLFNDGDLTTAESDSINGGFQSWADRCEPAVEENGIANVGIVKGDNYASAGIASTSTFDVSPTSGFKATFTIASLQAGAGRLVGLSIHSVNTARFMNDRVSALHREMIKPGAVRIDSDTADARRFPVGAGWAFEIDSIRKREGKTYVVLKSDHGLIVTPKGLRELYLPHRILSRETRWWINTVASTRPIRQTVDSPPLDLQTACVPILPEGAKPGIVHRILRTKEGSDEFEVVSMEIQTEFDFFSLSNQLHDYNGYLKIPTSGLYTFHFRPGSRGSLSIGRQVVSPEHKSPYVTGNIVPRRVRVRLEQGFVPIHWTFRGAGAGKYGGKGCGFTFEGPSVPRTKFRSGDFYHVPR